LPEKVVVELTYMYTVFGRTLNPPLTYSLIFFIEVIVTLMLVCRASGMDVSSHPVNLAHGSAASQPRYQPQVRSPRLDLCSQLVVLFIHCVQKRHPLTFLFISPWKVFRFLSNFQWISRRKLVFHWWKSWIFLLLMTSCWHHISALVHYGFYR